MIVSMRRSFLRSPAAWDRVHPVLSHRTMCARFRSGGGDSRDSGSGGNSGAGSGNTLADGLHLHTKNDHEDFATRVWKSIRGAMSERMKSESKDGSNQLVPSTPESRNRQMLAVGLSRRPLMPGMIVYQAISDPRLVTEIRDMLTQPHGAQAYVAAFMTKEERDWDEEDPSGNLYEVGTFAQVRSFEDASDRDNKRAQVLLYGHRRLRRLRTIQERPLKVEVEHLKDQEFDGTGDIFKATTMELASTMRELVNHNPLYTEQLKQFLNYGGDFQDPSRMADLGAALTSSEAAQLQAVLEQLSIPERTSMVLLLLKQELDLAKLQQKISASVEQRISKVQRQHFLMEQLKSIKKELGLEKDDKNALVDKFRDKFKPYESTAPKEAVEVVKEELAKLEMLEPASSEFNVTRNYLEWLTSIPWGHFSEEVYDLKHAQEVLDADHYGMQDVKDRIMEFIAVATLRGTAQGKIICLVGPPGVGKTSIGRSIARALHREYYRFSVGGLSDVAEIKGHRRTYVGAMPGKLVQCLKAVKSANPLVLIDEIDKIGHGARGDPASALLELLDPEQNTTFMDHYLDVPLDLSKVLFMCTANTLDTIPGPLLDRMEVIRLAGYITDEKTHISREYLEPQARKSMGVPSGAINLTHLAVRRLIENYCREPGVRNLKKHLEKVYRKVALKLVQRGAKLLPVEVDVEHVKGRKMQSSSSEAGEEGAGKKETGTGATHNVLGNSTDPAEESIVMDSKSSSAVPEREATYDGPQVVVDVEDLKEYVGQPPFASERIYEQMPVGVTTGLAWTSMGGSTLYVEVQEIEHGPEVKAGLKCTGQLGDVMTESSTIAHTFARRFHASLCGASHSEYFARSSLHLHVPAGGTPKDGPSAGCTIITSMLSLAMKLPVSPNLAMTGEVSLTGKVLPIGGVKEKTLAARRSGVRQIIFPEANRKDWEELNEDLRDGMEVHFASHYGDVYKIAFPDTLLPLPDNWQPL